MNATQDSMPVTWLVYFVEFPNYLILTRSVLSVRYKCVFFSNTNTAANAKEMLMIELQRLTAEEDKQDDHNQYEPPTRKPRREQASSSLDSIFDEIANEQASVALTPAAVGLTAQLETYLWPVRTSLCSPGWLIKCGSLLWPKWHADTSLHRAAVLTANGCLAHCHIL